MGLEGQCHAKGAISAIHSGSVRDEPYTKLVPDGHALAERRHFEIEGLAGAEFSFFQFRQWNLESTLLVFPSISSAGRVRMDWRTNLRFRLIRGKKIWWNLNGTINLDNDPPSTAPGSDYE